MKIKRYLCAFAAMLVILCGCGADSSEPGRVETITIAQLKEKMDKQEDFALVFTMTWCGHCATFMDMLDGYLPDHNVVVYDLVVDNEADYDKALEELKPLFPDFTGTPDLYYVEQGNIKSRFWDEFEDEGLDEITFHKWVKKYNLLDKETTTSSL